MSSALLILLAIASISLIIWALHKNHVRKTMELAESDNQLTPLPNQPDKPAPPVEPVAPVTAAAPVEPAKVSVVAEIKQGSQNSQSWSEEIKSLRDAGDLKAALALSKRQYPRMLAFKQTLITLRAGLKQEPDYSAKYLNDLYQTAILGDLVKANNNNKHTIDDIKKQLSNLGEPQDYWDRLGYKNLHLLTKTDCRLLSKHWGEPTAHSTIESLVSKTA